MDYLIIIGCVAFVLSIYWHHTDPSGYRAIAQFRMYDRWSGWDFAAGIILWLFIIWGIVSVCLVPALIMSNFA